MNRLPGVSGGAGGFTVIELLVVICIIAILVGFALPAYQNVRERANQRKAVVTAKHIELACSEFFNQKQRWPGGGAGGEVRGDLLVELLGGPGQTAFLDIGTNTKDTFKDPWGQDFYEVRFDVDFDNVVTGPGGEEIHKSVIVWNLHSYTNRGQLVTVTNKSWE